MCEINTYRFVEHCGPDNDDHLGYRPEHINKKDPLKEAEKELRKEPVMGEVIDLARATFKKEIDLAFEFAKQSPFPEKLMRPLCVS